MNSLESGNAHGKNNKPYKHARSMLIGHAMRKCAVYVEIDMYYIGGILGGGSIPADKCVTVCFIWHVYLIFGYKPPPPLPPEYTGCIRQDSIGLSHLPFKDTSLTRTLP